MSSATRLSTKSTNSQARYNVRLTGPVTSIPAIKYPRKCSRKRRRGFLRNAGTAGGGGTNNLLRDRKQRPYSTSDQGVGGQIMAKSGKEPAEGRLFLFARAGK